MTESNKLTGEIILYQTEDGQTKLEVRLEDEIVWLTQQQLATLLQTSKQNIRATSKKYICGRRIKRIFSCKEFVCNCR